MTVDTISDKKVDESVYRFVDPEIAGLSSLNQKSK